MAKMSIFTQNAAYFWQKKCFQEKCQFLREHDSDIFNT
jgi:hypothetical protein